MGTSPPSSPSQEAGASPTHFERVDAQDDFNTRMRAYSDLAWANSDECMKDQPPERRRGGVYRMSDRTVKEPPPQVDIADWDQLVEARDEESAADLARDAAYVEYLRQTDSLLAAWEAGRLNAMDAYVQTSDVIEKIRRLRIVDAMHTQQLLEDRCMGDQWRCELEARWQGLSHQCGAVVPNYEDLERRRDRQSRHPQHQWWC
eukprot:TRINITY_DN10379_c1_g4_i1.p1 TRINITY_DN10379_c1_g4~~TRINITY_DN10379_c1_g4_i1.p1  ORF type:complete len:203 (+),score=31.14 TRINITY_DN10379_c1_g4_i1:57-665(+)